MLCTRAIVASICLIVLVVRTSASCPPNTNMTAECAGPCSEGGYQQPEALCCRTCLMTSKEICLSSFPSFKGHLICGHILDRACAKTDDVIKPSLVSGKCFICRSLIANSTLREVEFSQCADLPDL